MTKEILLTQGLVALVDDDLADRIRAMYRTYQKDPHVPRDRTSLTIVSGFALPPRLELLAKPVRCDRCGKFFIPIQAHQKRHMRGTCNMAIRRNCGRH